MGHTEGFGHLRLWNTRSCFQVKKFSQGHWLKVPEAVTKDEVVFFAVELLKAAYIRDANHPRFDAMNKIRQLHINQFEVALRQADKSEEIRQLAVSLLDELKPGWNRC